MSDTEKEVCDGEVTLRTRALENNVIGKWTTTSSAVVKGTSTNEATTTGTEVAYTGLNGNSNTFFWTIYREGHEDCHADAQVVIENNHIEAGNILNKTVTCDGTIELEAEAIVDANASGEWTSSPGLDVTADGTAQHKATATGIEINESEKFIWTVTKGQSGKCYDTKTVEVANYQADATIDGKKVASTIACSTEAELIADAISHLGNNVHGQWTKHLMMSGANDVSIADGGSNRATASNLDVTGKYVFHWNVWREVDGKEVCRNFAELTVNNSMLSVDADTQVEGKAASACGDEYVLHGQTISGTVGKWTVKNGDAENITFSPDDTDANATVKGVTSDGITLTWTVSRANGSCPVSDEITIYNDKVDATVLVPASTCDGTVTLEATNDNVNGDDGKFTGFWSTTSTAGKFAGTDERSVQKAVVDYTGIGKGAKASFTWTLRKNGLTNNQSGKTYCESTKTVEVTNYEYTITAGYNHTTECKDEFALISANAPADTQCWWESSVPGVTFSQGDGEVNKIAGSVVNKTVASGLTKSSEHTFTLHADYNGCPKTATVVITDNNVDNAVINPVAGVTCEADVNLSANAPVAGKGKWTLSPSTITYTSGTNTDNVVTVSNLPANATATFTWTIANEDGTCAHVSEPVEVLNKHYENLIETPSQTVCGNTIDLDAKDVRKVYDVKGWWTSNNPTVNAAISASSEEPSITVTLPENSTVTFEWHAQYINDELGLTCTDD